MIKFVYMINRIEGMSLDAFITYHRDSHGPLFTSIPEAKRYVRKYTVSHPVAARDYPAPAYDGITELWFDNWADHDAFFASENYNQKVKPDEPNFIDFSSVATMVTDEKIVLS